MKTARPLSGVYAKVITANTCYLDNGYLDTLYMLTYFNTNFFNACLCCNAGLCGSVSICVLYAPEFNSTYRNGTLSPF